MADPKADSNSDSVAHSQVRTVVLPDMQAVGVRAAHDLAQVIQEIQANPQGGVGGDGVARIVLTGGSGGQAVHQALRAAVDAGEVSIDWSRVQVFFGDERWVPVDSPDRNDGQAAADLLDHVDIPAENIHHFDAPVAGDDAEEDAAALDMAAINYEADINRFAPEGFDVHMLGMGPEGHINSLFPHTEHLAEQALLVVPVEDCPKPPPTRVTLTMPAIARSAQVWLLVGGAGKAEAVAQIVSGGDPAQWPAAGVRGRVATVLYVDEAAAGR